MSNTFGTQCYRYEQAFDSVDRRSLAKVLSLYGIPEKCIKVICAMYKNNIAAVKVGMRLATGFVLNQDLSRAVFNPPLYGSFGWTLS